MEMYRTRSDGQWGHPVGIRAAAEWNLCPELTLPSGVAGTACQGATCMVVCEEGKVAVGKRRIKCRWTRKKGFFWKTVIKGVVVCLLGAWIPGLNKLKIQTLPECKGCSPDPPQPLDSNVGVTCSINSLGKKKCILQCSDGGKLFGRSKVKMTCKCPRNCFYSNKALCSLFHGYDRS